MPSCVLCMGVQNLTPGFDVIDDRLKDALRCSSYASSREQPEMYCRVIFADISLAKRWRVVTGCSRLCAQSCNRPGLIFQSKARLILPSAAAPSAGVLAPRWIHS